MKNPDREKRLESLFQEIKQGFSVLSENDCILYIKHPTANEIEISKQAYDKNFEKAIRSYKQAQEIYPSMRSPEIMIKQIEDLMKEQTI